MLSPNKLMRQLRLKCKNQFPMANRISRDMIQRNRVQKTDQPKSAREQSQNSLFRTALLKKRIRKRRLRRTNSAKMALRTAKIHERLLPRMQKVGVHPRQRRSPRTTPPRPKTSHKLTSGEENQVSHKRPTPLRYHQKCLSLRRINRPT